MTNFIVNENGISSLGSVSKAEEIGFNSSISINPPPADGKCQGCGRSLEELKPFGKAGDPLVGDFDGELLVKRWRRMIPYDYDQTASSWECRNCIVLDGEEILDRLDLVPQKGV
jgi:hypothetical protein